jgi:PAS domain-containing protein
VLYCLVQSKDGHGQKAGLPSVTVEIFDNYIALNADGVFTYGNSAAFTIFGRPNQRLPGKNIWEVLPDLKESLLYSTFQEAVYCSSSTDGR